jgi:hypothetical protein
MSMYDNTRSIWVQDIALPEPLEEVWEAFVETIRVETDAALDKIDHVKTLTFH